MTGPLTRVAKDAHTIPQLCLLLVEIASRSKKTHQESEKIHNWKLVLKNHCEFAMDSKTNLKTDIFFQKRKTIIGYTELYP